MLTRELHRRFVIGAPAVLLLMFGASARAGYLSETGMIQVVTPPPSVKVGAFQSDSFIRTFAENQSLTLATSVSVNDTASGTFKSNASLVAGTVLAGTSVDSYFFHSDPASGNKIYDGSVTFSTAILGVILLNATLDATDAQLGHAGTKYPFGNDRGLELSATEDNFTLSADKRTLIFHFSTHSSVDEVRVLTAATVPEPTSVAMLGLGLVILTGVARRNRRAATAA